MKKILLVAVISILGSLSAFSQKIAHVDTEYILGKIPAYQQAQTKLDNLSKDWQTEVEKQFTELDEMYKKYQAECDMLPEATKTKRENEIIDKEKQAKELQKKYFGTNGELAKKRQELIKPIQDNVYNALKSVASEAGYDYIFDKVTGDIIYANEKYDESDEVLNKIIK
ncbi:MAG: OmpH family outer membrane protein [Bacteroidales bacterium]|nr:OmpH family outer membrane protein [Bacteroidales bacterium]